ncbi:ComEC/Rec2 family competence protein [Tellurirhabdus bombi]|uniref:ComEC/Rec2 family competence protein n=1 Tax=Tellurirhabdus bombi TaxID=2907205 RepID=UPI001F3FE8D6|nr:ComEC/Rec2 family competence protein [Tellurirhabdus bombi]
MHRWSAYPFVRYVTALSIGIIVCLYKKDNFSLALILTGVSGGSFLVTALFQRKGSFGRLVSGLSGLIFLAGLGWLVTYRHTASNDPTNLTHSQQPIRAYEGVVNTQAEQREKTFRLEVSVRRVRTDSSWQTASGTVLVYLDKNVAQKPRYGDVWLIRGSPKAVDPPRNPGQFNYKRFLAHRQIYHQQYVRPADRQVIGYAPASRLTALAFTVNAWADSVFTHHVGTGQEFAIVKAMILGVRDSIDPELQQAYSAAGAVHVLSVSGLHVGVLFAALTFLLGFLKNHDKGRYVFFALMLGLLWFYALMTGFSAPVLRSAFMFSLILLGQVLNRKHTMINTLAASAFLILLIDPFAITTAGFQLSYLAVGGLTLWQRPLYQSLRFENYWVDSLWKITSVALVAQLATFPLSVYYFHQFPTYFWLANPLVIPLSSLVLILAMALLAVSWIPLLSMLLGMGVYAAMWALNQSILLTEKLPYSVLKGLVLTPLELALLSALLLSLIVLLTERKKAWLWGALGCGSFLMASVSWTHQAQNRQRLTIVHAVPRNTVVAQVRGRSATIFSEKPLTVGSKEFSFNLQGTYDSLGVPVEAITFIRLSLPSH